MAEEFGENFRGGRLSVNCPFCNLHVDSQEQVFNNCTFIQEQIEINGNYMDIFESKVDQSIIKSIARISSFRKS